MEALLLLEYDARAEGTRQALLGRVECLALASQGRLRFVATEREGQDLPLREIMALELSKPAALAALLSVWQADASFPPGVKIRTLKLEAVRVREPALPLFP